MEHSAYQIDAMQVLRSSWVIILMLVLSVVVLAVTIERWFYFARTKLDSDKFLEKIKAYVIDGKYNDAINFCKQSKGTIPIVIREGLEERSLPRDEVAKLMEASQAEQKVNLQRYLNILGTLGNTAPFIGLLGTVLGIIKAFRDLAGSAGGGPEVVMVGIAEALIATAAGLAVAIPAVIIFNYYMDRVKNICVEMDTMAKKVLVILANYGEGAHARRK
ncbi:MAG TPA: MotA/TolQ/ExbB proton channel family protein [Candidatus Goldiibacteriota bacterium]|nr:MotA/TolQ/ExbB proton channel family protein [Candidatus Goldiibacteriota bacterium]